MKTLTRFLLIVCLILKTLSENEDQFGDQTEAVEGISFQNAEVENTSEKLTEETSNEALKNDFKTVSEEGRSIGNSYEVHEHEVELDEKDHNIADRHAEFKKRAKPLKNIFMGIYKNYKSTYLGNRTSLEYKQRLKDRINASMGGVMGSATIIENVAKTENTAGNLEAEEIAKGKDEMSGDPVKMMNAVDKVDLKEPKYDSVTSKDEAEEKDISVPTEATELKKTLKPKSSKKRRKRKPVRNTKTRESTKSSPFATRDEPLTITTESEYRYNVGPGLNLSLDMNNDIVNVKLDGLALRELFAGRWLLDNTEEGRGKKYDMISKVLPLFILPFLIQSAIIPFLVTKLKLLLVKSILIGKLAIFLLIISAFKNSGKNMQTYEVAPSYWAGEPSRRSELAAAAPSSPYSGYRVEGKPAAWIN